MVGNQICINQPGPKYTPPSGGASATPSVTITQAPVPSDIANGTNTYCAKFHDAVVGEYCNTLMLRYGISLSDFLFLNPSVNENCTNLYANESYCVRPVGDINTYPGRPGYTSYTAVLPSITGDPATSLPTVNWTVPTPTTTSMPLASGSRDDCWRYFNGSHYQNDITDDSTFQSECDLAATVLGVTLEDLGTWNPSLGNTSLSNCTFKPNTRYCGIYYFGEKPIPTPVDDTSPIRENTTSSCYQYLDVWDGSGYTCQDILDEYKITTAQFYQWNPSVKSDCSGLWPGSEAQATSRLALVSRHRARLPPRQPPMALLVLPKPVNPQTVISGILHRIMTPVWTLPLNTLSHLMSFLAGIPLHILTAVVCGRHTRTVLE